MKLTKETYFSPEMEAKYLGSSSFKTWDIFGTGCEAKQAAIRDGEWEKQSNDAFLLGSYLHAWSEDRLPEFMTENPSLFKKDGTLYAKYALGDKMIDVLKNDLAVEEMRTGEKEVIMTGEISGVPFKIQVDILNIGKGRFVDLKTTRNIKEKIWNPETKEKENFILHWDYLLQFAIYAEIIRQNLKMNYYLQPYVIAVDKQDCPDHEIIEMGTSFIESKLEEIESKLPHIMDVRNGKLDPVRCDNCDYCRSTKKITKTIHYLDL